MPIISYYISCSFILSLLLIWSPFYSILFYSTLFPIDSIRFDPTLFYWIRFTVLFSIVSYINEWFMSICPSICLSVCVFICMNKFMFSLLSCFFILSLLFFYSLFILISLSLLFSYERLPHTHTDTDTDTDTDTQIHMNICSFLWLVHITSKVCKWRIVFEW